MEVPNSLDNLTLGQKIKLLRTEKGLSQTDLADGLCTMSAISQFENDKIKPRAELLEKLAVKLNVSLLTLLKNNTDDTTYDLDVIEILVQKNNFNDAFEKISKLNKEDFSTAQTGRLTILEAECLSRTGRPDLAVMKINYLFEENHFLTIRLQVSANKTLGSAYYFLSDMVNSYIFYHKAYSLFLENEFQDAALRADIAQNLGLVCNNLGKYDQSRLYLAIALEFYESVSDIVGLADAYYALGIATKSHVYIAKAKELYANLGIVKLANMVKQYEAFHLRSVTDPSSAIEELVDCADGFYHIGDKQNSLYSICRAIKVANENQMSVDILLSRANILVDQIETPNHPIIPFYHQTMSETSYRYKRFDDAVHFGQKSFMVFDKIGMYSDAADSLQVVADSFSELGNYKKANEIQRSVIELLRNKRV